MRIPFALLFLAATPSLNAACGSPPTLGYDSAYIATYKHLLTVRLITGGRINSIQFTDSLGHSVPYDANSPTQFGLGLTYGWLSADGMVSFPGLSDPALGRSRSFVLGASFTGRRLWAVAFWNHTRGYYVSEPASVSEHWSGDGMLPTRPDMAAGTALASVNYALSRKCRFSQSAAITQVERQKRSAGTFLVGGALWYTTVSADSSLVPTSGALAFAPDARIDEATRLLAGGTIGYAHTFVLWKRFFVHGTVLTGVGLRSQRLHNTVTDRWERTNGIASISDFRVSLGYNGDRFHVALLMALYSNTDPRTEEVQLGSVYGNVRLSLGMRFGDVHIKPLEKRRP